MSARILHGTFCMLLTVMFFSCAWEQMEPQIDCSISPVEIVIIESENSKCNASDGSFIVVAAGGEAPYLFNFEAGSNATGVFENVQAGNYTVSATDALGCSAEIDVSIENEEGVNLQNINISEAGCGSGNGNIQISATGGTEPYQFSLNGSNIQESNVFSGLNSGTYTVNVTDQNGCSVTESVKITSGISYSSSIKAIIENSCAVSGCHNGSVSPDLRSFSTIQSRAGAIKSRTANGSMPRGSTLSQNQIEMIACWVDDGALQN